jgi:intracellular septation protein
MKLLYDIFPVIVFFIVYKLFGIYVATGGLIVASAIQILYLWFRYRRLETMHVITFVLVLVFGGATILLHDTKFLQWKVSIINWLFGLAFLLSQWFTKTPLIKRLMQKNIGLPDRIWKQLNLMWAIFFCVMGVINIIVAYHFSLNAWVEFKVFGILGLTIAFVILQSVYLYRHIKDHPQPNGDKK